MNDDCHIVERALTGDRAAFGDLVRMYQDRLFCAVLQVTGSTEEAEEVVQDSFVRAFTKLHTFQRNSRFFTWLYRIAINNALSGRRRRRNELSVDLVGEAGGGEPVDGGRGPDAPMLEDERVRMVRQALHRLSKDHRGILILREMEGCSYEAIAEILGISTGTVRSRLSRARAQMKLAFEELEASQGATR